VGRLESPVWGYQSAQKPPRLDRALPPGARVAETRQVVLDMENLEVELGGRRRWALRAWKIAGHAPGNLLRTCGASGAERVRAGRGVDADAKKAMRCWVVALIRAERCRQALFGAAAALSRNRTRREALGPGGVWRSSCSRPGSRALLVRLRLAAAGELESGALLEKYAAGYQRQRAADPAGAHPGKATRPGGPSTTRPGARDPSTPPVLREARAAPAALRMFAGAAALENPTTSTSSASRSRRLRARLRDARAAREMTPSPGRRDTSLRCRSRPGVKQPGATRRPGDGNAQWSWTELERSIAAWERGSGKAAVRRGRAAAEATSSRHRGSIGSAAGDPAAVMATLNRKDRAAAGVRKRAEETVAMRQAEPAVCALAQLARADAACGQAIATSRIRRTERRAAQALPGRARGEGGAALRRGARPR